MTEGTGRSESVQEAAVQQVWWVSHMTQHLKETYYSVEGGSGSQCLVLLPPASWDPT